MHNVHVSAVVVVPPVHIYPASIEVQERFHPSPLAVFPSSHVSEACLNPSPQITTHEVLPPFGLVPPVHAEQVSAVVVDPPVQIYPGSIVEQMLLHPSPFAVLPSSQASAALTNPSPQITIHAELPILGLVPSVHCEQTSIDVVDPPTQI